ncbi:MAG: hypothetical protein ACLPVF_20445 [Acidimicrobiales bacterium]
MASSWRVITAVGLFVLAVVGIVFAVIALLREPPTVDFTANHVAGQPVDVTLQTVGTYGSGPHPSWVSYLIKSPQGQWVHTTLFEVPAHTRLNVTIYNYDSGSPLRNQQVGQITGTYGHIALLNGKPVHLINSNAGNGVGHTFSIPTLGINVPLYGNNGNANLCAAAVCTTKSPHQIIKFSFTTPGPGNYPWQCFVPCGLGFLYGNGGPMQTIGFMDGFMKVVA